ncbi:MAG: hypothetical protein EOO92_26680, partial [Pedobacter sp.]
MKKLLLLLSIFIACLSVQAQTSSVKKAQASFEKAQEHLKTDRFDLAIFSLDEAVKADPGFQFAYIQLADINRRIKAYHNAKLAYNSALTIGPVADVRLYYGLAEAEINTGDYTNALQHITTFVNNYQGTDQDFIKKANKY